MSKNRVKIEYKDGEETKFVYVKRPDRKIYQKAHAVSCGAFRAAIENDAILRSEIDKIMKERGLWDDDKQKQLEDIDKRINDGLLALKQGGISLKEARSIAIDVRRARNEKVVLLARRDQLDDFSAETLSENERFDYIVSQCVLDENGDKIFNSVDDYREKANEIYAIKAAQAIGTMTLGFDEDWEANLPENQFLIKHNFVDNNLQLINNEGKFVTEDNKLIDENFRYVNEDGQLVDENGNLIDEDGLPVVEFSPFLDENGNPVE